MTIPISFSNDVTFDKQILLGTADINAIGLYFLHDGNDDEKATNRLQSNRILLTIHFFKDLNRYHRLSTSNPLLFSKRKKAQQTERT